MLSLRIQELLIPIVFAMDNLESIIHTALQRYYNHLTVFGQMNYNSVYRLIVGMFLNDLINLTDPPALGQFVTDTDYRVIKEALYKIFGSTCLVDYPSFITQLVDKGVSTPDFTPRVTEDNVLRSSETDAVRSS